jgi:hypothetical protein
LRKHHEEALKLREMFIDGKIEQCWEFLANRMGLGKN